MAAEVFAYQQRNCVVFSRQTEFSSIDEESVTFNGYALRRSRSNFSDGLHSREEFVIANESEQAFSVQGSTDVVEFVLDRGEARLLEARSRAGDCIYCASPLTAALTRNLKVYERRVHFREHSLSEAVRVCQACGWWVFDCHTLEDVSRVSTSSSTYRYYGKLKAYDVASSDVPIAELKRWLSNHPERVTDTDPFRFEALIADVFGDVYGDVEVVHLGGRKDGGVDLKLVRGDRVEAIVQIKRRANLDRAESVSVVRELNGVLLHQGVNKGIVVTTARRFSPEARKEATSTGASLARYGVELRAFDDIIGMLNLSRRADDEHLLAEITSNHVPHRREVIALHERAERGESPEIETQRQFYKRQAEERIAQRERYKKEG